MSSIKKIVKQVMLTSKFRYTEIILGPEWLPGLLDDEGAAVRAVLGKMTGQTSMPLGEPLGGGEQKLGLLLHRLFFRAQIKRIGGPPNLHIK